MGALRGGDDHIAAGGTRPEVVQVFAHVTLIAKRMGDAGDGEDARRVNIAQASQAHRVHKGVREVEAVVVGGGKVCVQVGMQGKTECPPRMQVGEVSRQPACHGGDVFLARKEEVVGIVRVST